MDQFDLLKLLHRESFVHNIKQQIQQFETEQQFKGIYIYGNTGIGKTYLVKQLLKELNYDIVPYDINNTRNMSILTYFTTKYNTNIISVLNKQTQKIAVVIDEMDYLTNADKIIVNSLIKILSPTKTKTKTKTTKTKTTKTPAKMKLTTPIIFIGNSNTDKKIKELMKECTTYWLPSPTTMEMEYLISLLFANFQRNVQQQVLSYVDTDLHKLSVLHQLITKCPDILPTISESLLQKKTYIDDTKNITKDIINGRTSDIVEHKQRINETDRTSIGLLWHENVIDILEQTPKDVGIPMYTKILKTLSFADYIDRVTFQKQIWQFNEMSSLMKTFKNNKLLHEIPTFQPLAEARFTKILTKYSTEYNNLLFLQKMCQKTGMDKKDLYCYFISNKSHKQTICDQYDISKLELNRLYRLLEKLSDNTSSISANVINSTSAKTKHKKKSELMNDVTNDNDDDMDEDNDLETYYKCKGLLELELELELEEDDLFL